MKIRAVIEFMFDIHRLLGDRRQVIPHVVAMGSVLAFFDLLGLYFLGKFVALVAVGDETVTFGLNRWKFDITFGEIAIFLGFVYVGRAIVGIFINYWINAVTAHVEADLKSSLLLQYQIMPYGDRVRRGLGEMVEAVNGWTASFARAIVAPLSRFISESTVSLTIAAYFLYLYPKAILLFFVLTLFVVLFYDVVVRRWANASATTYRQLSVSLADEVQDSLAGYKEILVFNLPRFFAEKIRSSAIKMCLSLARSVTIAQTPRLVIEAFLVVSAIVVLWGMGRFGVDIRTELPDIAIIAVGLMRISSWFSLSTAMLSNLRLYRPIVSSLARDLNIGDATFLGSPISAKKDKKFIFLQADDVSFAYDQDSKIFSGLHFRIDAGDQVAIVGRSGAGKTTLVDIMMGLVKPTTGQLTVAMSEGDTKNNLVGVASYVPQTTFILNDTLRRNVALGVADNYIDDARVILALKKAKLLQFSDSQFLEMSVGDRGCKISGGQRQRVALARAFYFGRSVLILDEATNSLDAETEKLIVKDLLDMKNEITLIVITHQPEIAKLFPKTLDLSRESLLVH